MRNSKYCLLPEAILLAVIASWGGGCATYRKVEVQSTPDGASVFLNEKLEGKTPHTFPELVFSAGKEFHLKIEKEGYEPEERTLKKIEAKQVGPINAVWRINVPLKEARRTALIAIEATPPGSTVVINGKTIGKAPLTNQLVFARAKGATAWETNVIRVENPPNYETQERRVTYEQATGGGTSPVLSRLAFELAELVHDTVIDVIANIPDVDVIMDERRVGPAGEYKIQFKRPDSQSPWSIIALKIEKEGYRYWSNGLPMANYSRELKLDEINGPIRVGPFEPVRFISVPLRTYDASADQFRVSKANVFSQIESSPGDKATRITYDSDNGAKPFVSSRISTTPQSADQFYCVVPWWEDRSSGNETTDEKMIGANIWKITSGNNKTQMTSDRSLDLDPFATPDGKWIYYSSDRLKYRNIWRIPTTGQTTFTPITRGESIDTEPAVSRGDEATPPRLAYTSRPAGALAGSPSYIWIANWDGSLPTQTTKGRSPAWSPDGKKLAYVSPENKIWVLSVDEGIPMQLTTGDAIDSSPVWTPDGRNLLYASIGQQKKSIERNSDIWRISSTGGVPSQLTSDGSFDAIPAVTKNAATGATYVYFFSNRGAQRPGQETLQIWRMQLSAE